MKKILAVIASAAGLFAVTKQIRDKQTESRLWAEATDNPRS